MIRLNLNCICLIFTAGVIDRDYRGNVGVVLFNLSKSDYKVKRGDRIAQLILERVFTLPLIEVEVRISFIDTSCTWCMSCQMQELPPTERGSGGFGSTGQ